jgi:hypothetical protein
MSGMSDKAFEASPGQASITPLFSQSRLREMIDILISEKLNSYDSRCGKRLENTRDRIWE